MKRTRDFQIKKYYWLQLVVLCCYGYTNQAISPQTHNNPMEYPQNEMSCSLSLISSDLENFETVEELYFGEREKENDQEADDSPLDESNSESEDNGETRTCIDFADTTDLSE